MSSTNQFTYLESPRLGKVSVPIHGGSKVLLDCVAQIKPSFLIAEFLPGKLPLNTIDLEKKCFLSFDTGGAPLNISADIQKVVEGCKLILVELDLIKIRQAQKRGFFRIDTEVPIELSIKATTENTGEPVEVFTGKTTNISGGGLLVSFPEPLLKPLKAGQHITVNLLLPEPKPQTVLCKCIVIRDQILDDRSYLVSLKYDNLEEENLDKIIAFCLARQRKELQLRVHILGT